MISPELEALAHAITTLYPYRPTSGDHLARAEWVAHRDMGPKENEPE